MKKLKILYGICGLGNGHTFRQLPIVEYFSRISKVMIFGHDNSYHFYASHFNDHPSVKVVEVAIPFYVGTNDGIDFGASAASPMNQKNIFNINCAALDLASKKLGKPDLVITDYESISAQYAYAHNVPLVTIDQQSKYLCGNFPKELHGFTFNDEIERLHIFFPKASARIACSFFNFPLRPKGDAVHLFPPTIKDAVLKIKRAPRQNSILVYISSAREFGQTPEDVVSICSEQRDITFHVFFGEGTPTLPMDLQHTNVNIYPHGDPIFDEILGQCSGIVSTAGHSLLSEAMYLGIPVYAIPISPYEQHMNAHIINQHGFGISYHNFTVEKLAHFINNLHEFEKNIASDRTVLLRGVGQTQIIDFLEKNFLIPK